MLNKRHKTADEIWEPNSLRKSRDENQNMAGNSGYNIGCSGNCLRGEQVNTQPHYPDRYSHTYSISITNAYRQACGRKNTNPGSYPEHFQRLPFLCQPGAGY